MRALIVDYYGVLDGPDEDRQGWEDILRHVRANGVGIAVLSNCESEASARPIQELEAQGLIDAAVLSYRDGVEKPDPEAFRLAAERLGVDQRDCVFVDDHIEYVHAAVHSGLVGVMYKTFERTQAELGPLVGLVER